MSVVSVNTPSHAYDVLVNEVSLADVGALCRRVSGTDDAFIVSDSNVAPLYGALACKSLRTAGYAVEEFVFPAGEASKTLSTYGACLRAMADAGCTRSSVVVALGGGVVGDLAGFAAATYMRGCRCVQVPTSLLACVDSSVGGKTAVDLPQGKNLAGAFFQPDAVLVDTSLLGTLPQHFFTDGCAEVLKYGCIADAALFDELAATPLAPGDARLGRVIERCVQIKRDVVEADEREAGARQVLNFGHTLGHAIERLSGFSTTHGFAVACGMALMSKACAMRGWCAPEVAQRIEDVVRAHGFSAEPPAPVEEMYEASLSDKKRHGTTMSVVALDDIGAARVRALPLEEYHSLVSCLR